MNLCTTDTHNRRSYKKKNYLLFDEPSTAERKHEISKHLFLLTETVFKHGTLHVHFFVAFMSIIIVENRKGLMTNWFTLKNFDDVE